MLRSCRTCLPVIAMRSIRSFSFAAFSRAAVSFAPHCPRRSSRRRVYAEAVFYTVGAGKERGISWEHPNGFAGFASAAAKHAQALPQYRSTVVPHARRSAPAAPQYRSTARQAQRLSFLALTNGKLSYKIITESRGAIRSTSTIMRTKAAASRSRSSSTPLTTG